MTWSFVLARGPGVQLRAKTVPNADGDLISIVTDVSDSGWGASARSNPKLLLVDLFDRYYQSFVLPERLLPGVRSPGDLAHSDTGFNALLDSRTVKDPGFPRVFPLRSVHEDSHLRRLEFQSTRRTEHRYAEAEDLDFPNVEITSGSEYKFKGHGDSSRTQTNFLGRRLELTTSYSGADPVEVYQKLRMDENGRAVARTLVLKDGTRTVRVRLSPNQEADIPRLASDVLSREFGRQKTVAPARSVVSLRSAAKIGLGSMDSLKEVGRLSVDQEAVLQRPVPEAVFDGKLPFLETRRSLSLNGDMAAALEHQFHSQGQAYHVESRETRLVLESVPEHRAQVERLVLDIKARLGL